LSDQIRPVSTALPSAPLLGRNKSSSVPLLQELLFAFGVLFATAILLVVLAVLVLLQVGSPRDATLVLSALVVADLIVIFGFGGYILRKKLARPVERLVADVRLMTEGGDHRVGSMPGAELQTIAQSVNALADRLMRDQALLAENVQSLERTNLELVEARNQVIRAARLASVGTLAAGIAHEVGNPLGAIVGYIDVAIRRAARDGQDTTLLEALRDEARRIDRIVKSLLDYARPRNKEPELVAPGLVLERVRELLSAQGKFDDVQVVWRFDDAIPVVQIDPSRLEQVMVNLLLNALDAVAGRPDARIEVSLTTEIGASLALPVRREDDPTGVNYLHRRRAMADRRKEGPDPLFTAIRVVVIRIADNGPGIPTQDLERIFDPFFTTKAPGKGTGLGLAICAQLVESMGGRIAVGNQERGGAVFAVRIPGTAAVRERKVMSGAAAAPNIAAAALEQGAS
jgi:signal transduction histidine kinase